MFSKLRKLIVYTDISSDIIEHDEDMDGELWNYDGIDVYRGSFDPRYTTEGIQVYWLYDDNLKRVGLAEHEVDSPEVYKVLWYRDTPFATLFQEDGWTSKNCTLWSMFSNEAYQDCIEDDFKSVRDWAMRSGTLLVTPEMYTKKQSIYSCTHCGKKSLSELKSCLAVEMTDLDFNQFSILFLDDSFVMYEAPREHRPPYACVAQDETEEAAHQECLESLHPEPSQTAQLQEQEQEQAQALE